MSHRSPSGSVTNAVDGCGPSVHLLENVNQVWVPASVNKLLPLVHVLTDFSDGSATA